ncbi:MAG: aldehyde dehydrogenase family protein [Pseudomonadota bacterium]|nr:aldehyde dehydrogenase family protein [Pseudomonadota bacterium]
MTDLLSRLGLTSSNSGAWAGGALPDAGHGTIASRNPANGDILGEIQLADVAQYEQVVATAVRVQKAWQLYPAPKRGEVIRQMADALRAKRDDLGALVSLEVGKIRGEGVGEVQEAIDIADFCVGLSRQLYGLSMQSERANHRMYEQWHPLGSIAVITAFNFPCAVWAWNAMVAAICGDAVVWKPSLKAPLVAIATHRICEEVLAKNGFSGLFGLVIGADKDVGETMIRDHRLPLVSATGSVRMGRYVGTVVAERLGRTLLELGGNNAIIVDKDADLDLALRGILFGAVGTAGQRCTTTRRLFLHRDISARFTERLVKLYEQVRIGDPLQDGVLMGPLIDEDAVTQFETAVLEATREGGTVLTGGKRIAGPGHFVQPTLISADPKMAIVKHETFAPILYVMEFFDLDEAIRMQNDVPQGLSSSIFTTSFISAETFLSARGSDCGIANVNIGTSGAEIGGAFGGEKETGGGRESGSDSWKAYMRRQTCTLNYGKDLPLAQNLRFDL